VDTGSIGLRVVSSAAGGQLSLELPAQTEADGDSLAECGALVDSYTWGSVRLADVVMGGEVAASVPIQLIGDPASEAVPESCYSSGGASADTVADLGANAILGVGPLAQDCGSPCADSPDASGSENPGNVYYACASSGCRPTAVPVASQIQNPVSRLDSDNNGVVVDLSSVSSDGAPSVTGTLYLGIGTQPNNALGTATVLPIDPSSLTFTTVYLGRPYAGSFIDSGSNGYYFLSSKVSGLPACSDSSGGYYCPSGTTSIEVTNRGVTNRGVTGATSVVAFRVANADTLLSHDSDFVFDNLAGPSESGAGFDFGLPFFFGRRVFSSIEGTEAPGGTSPYVAY
jgi:hypothetical protein